MNFQRVLHTLAATQVVPQHTRLPSRENTRVPPSSRGAPFRPTTSRGRILSLRGRERIPGVPVASQEEVLSTGKVKGTPGSCHHSQSPPDVSVHSRETCFPCTASTFKPRIDSHHGGTWESPVGKLPGKASWESLEGKQQIPRSSRREARHCCYSSEGKRTCMPPLETRTDSPGETPEIPQDPCQHWRGILQLPAPNPHKVLGRGIDGTGISRRGALHMKGERNSRVVPPF